MCLASLRDASLTMFRILRVFVVACDVCRGLVGLLLLAVKDGTTLYVIAHCSGMVCFWSCFYIPADRNPLIFPLSLHQEIHKSHLSGKSSPGLITLSFSCFIKMDGTANHPLTLRL